MPRNLIQPPHWERLPRWRRGLGLAALGVVGLMLAWVIAGVVPAVPSIVEVFGWTGIRIPGAVTVGALLVASVAFAEF